MKFINPHTALRATACAFAICSVTAVSAADGFIVNAAQESEIEAGMTRAEVRTALGQPAQNVKYRSEPGKIWTYGVSNDQRQVFDVHYTADGRVLSSHEHRNSALNN
jgi:outer membrane protein assembly factor BamE (lipoprotein component of BamABCDE complex)